MIIFMDLRNKFTVLGVLRSTAKKVKKNLTLKEKPSFRLIFFFSKTLAHGNKPPPPTPFG